MSRYPLFGTSQTGKSLHVTSQKRLNVFAEINREGERSSMSWYQRPGLTLFGNLGDTPARGMTVVGDNIYAVHRGVLYSINNAGVATAQGTLLTTSGRVGIANNGTEVMIVDGTYGYIYETVLDTFAQISDGDFPASDTVAFQGGRFIVNKAGTGQFYLSASYDGTAWDATEFATAEGFPDDLVAVFVDQGEVMLFGPFSLEIWANVGAVDFPYARVQGAAVEWGLAARWSIAKFNNTIVWLGQNRMGEVQVVRLSGYVPQPISNPELEFLINGYGTVSDATALAYMSNGHPFYQLNFPSASKSWLFDGQTGLWSELEYGTVGARHRAEIGVQFINKTIVSDYENGRLYQVNGSVLSDNGVDFAKELISRHLFDEEQISIGRVWVDMETGQGNLTTEPQAMLQISKDGGNTWGPEKWSQIGKEGEYKDRAVWRRLGTAKDWTLRLRISDSIKTPISGAWVDAQ
jgi:hypothetical protein